MPGLPEHPKAGPAFALGLLVFPGAILTAGLGLLAAPFALMAGHRACADMSANPGRWDGAGKATAGCVIGVVGTIVLVLGAVVGVVFYLTVVREGGLS